MIKIIMVTQKGKNIIEKDNNKRDNVFGFMVPII